MNEKAIKYRLLKTGKALEKMEEDFANYINDFQSFDLEKADEVLETVFTTVITETNEMELNLKDSQDLCSRL